MKLDFLRFGSMHFIPICLIFLQEFVSGQDVKLVIDPPFKEDGTYLTALGNSIVFTCKALGLDPGDNPYLRWFNQRGQEIKEGDGGRKIRVSLRDLHEFKLYISDVQGSDGGQYYCTGRLQGADRKAAVTLQIYRKITFDRVPNQQFFKIYSNALVNCDVLGNPVPEISWTYRGRDVKTGAKFLVKSRALQINNITKDNEGVYKCVAEQRGLVESKDIQVHIQIPPKIVSFPATVSTSEAKHEFGMICKATGKPDPSFEFFKDGSRAPLSTQNRRTVDGRAKGGIIYFRPPRREDSGKYRCRAINLVGEDNKEAELIVQVPPRIPWPHGFRNVSALEGSRGELLCEVEAVPEAEITFTKLGGLHRAFHFGENDNGHVVISKPERNKLLLTIKKLQWGDHANYTCRATNAAGYVHQNASLQVESVPRFNSRHPMNKKTMLTWNGKTRNMTCQVDGYPYPHIEWWKNNYRLQDNATFHIYRPQYNWGFSALAIQVRDGDNNWIYDYYKCKAKNKHGEAEWEVRLREATRPSKPEAVNVVDKSATDLELRITPPSNDGGMPVIGYHISYGGGIYAITPRIGELIRIEGLEPSQSYTFRVRSQTAVGFSDNFEFAATMKEVTAPLPLHVIGSPQGVHAYEYTLFWDKPRTGGLPIIYYEFKIRRLITCHKQCPCALDSAQSSAERYEDWSKIRLGADSFGEETSKNVQNVRSYTFYGLRAGSTYQVQARAWNGGGGLPTKFTFHTASSNDVICDSAPHLSRSVSLMSLLLILRFVNSFLVL